MASFNQVTILGNATRDPQMKMLPAGGGVAEWGMACNRKFKTSGGEDREDVLFIDCAAFGKLAEVVNNYVTKGKQMLVAGRLKMDQWEDKNGGGKRSKISVVVDQMQLLGSRDDAPHDEQPAPRGNYPRTRDDLRTKATTPPFGDEQQLDPDSIPF